jgi:hypothetical protein
MKKPMHRLALPVFLLSCSSLAFAGPVTTYVDNFEGIAGYTVLSNQYADATFVNALELQASDLDEAGYPPHSGTGEITDDGSGDANDFGDAIVVDFSAGMSTVSGWYTDPYGVVVTAYDAGGNVISTFNGAAVYNADLQFQVFDTSGLDPIASISIEDAGQNWFSTTVDDLSYTTTPEPGSFVLLGTGLLGLAGALRRKFVR